MRMSRDTEKTIRGNSCLIGTHQLVDCLINVVVNVKVAYRSDEMMNVVMP